MDSKVRVIGVGHHEGGEHVVGLLVAQQVRSACGDRAEVLECGDAIRDLSTQWADADDVIVVDAVRGRQPGAVHRYDAHDQRAGDDRSAAVRSCIERAARDGRLPRRLTVYEIEAGRLEREAGVSPELVSAARRVASQILAELDRLEAPGPT